MSTGPSSIVSPDEIKKFLLYLRQFVRNPVACIKQIPHWSWSTILLSWACLLIGSGVASGFFTRKLGDLLVGLFIFPISGLIMAAITSAFFYHVVHLFLRRELSFRTLYSLTVLAALPYLLFRIVVSVLPPADVVGLAFSALLLIVGLVENFSLPRLFVTRLVVGLFGIFLLFWLYSQINLAQYNLRPRLDVTPESFDRLERELKQTN